MRWVVAALLGLCAGAASAEAWPPIAAIEFSGNAVTQDKVMRREMIVAVGDPADPERIEKSRQYVQDLGLFRWVRVEQFPARGGGVRLVFSVDEKWYILPYPRASATVEGQTSFGGDLRWANIGGLNHSLRFSASRTDPELKDRETQDSVSISYVAPYAFDSPYRIGVSAAHVVSNATDPVPHDETFDSATVFVSRTYPGRDGPRSQGTTVGAGLIWQREDRGGPGVPPPYGQATALTASYGQRDIRFRTYSEEGHSWYLSVAAARRGIASDYDYQDADFSWWRYVPVGVKEHQTLHYGLNAGIFASGPAEIEAYTFGGSSTLRGYPVNSLEGNAYYLFTAEFFRPIYRRSVRAGVILEAGKVFARASDAHLEDIDASLGLALRVRFTRFVNLELELGYAIPLDGGGGKLFGGRV